MIGFPFTEGAIPSRRRASEVLRPNPTIDRRNAMLAQHVTDPARLSKEQLEHMKRSRRALDDRERSTVVHPVGRSG